MTQQLTTVGGRLSGEHDYECALHLGLVRDEPADACAFLPAELELGVVVDSSSAVIASTQTRQKTRSINSSFSSDSHVVIAQARYCPDHPLRRKLAKCTVDPRKNECQKLYLPICQHIDRCCVETTTLSLLGTSSRASVHRHR